jgi:ferritin-like metal-binding protein YciE
MRGFYNFFIYELRELYSAAQYLTQVLKRMSSKATDKKLVEMLDTYYSQSQYQIRKLDEFFNLSKFKGGPVDCKIMSKLCDHARASMGYNGSKEIRDLALILSLNMMKHFERTFFRTLHSHASLMKLEDMLDLLHSLQIKIAQEQTKPLEIASSIMKTGKQTDLKEEAEELLGSIAFSQTEDVPILLNFLPELQNSVQSPNLKEALDTYQSNLEEYLEVLNSINRHLEGVEIEEWNVMKAFISEFKEDRNHVSQSLTDITVVFFIQRIQHQNIASFEIETLLSGHTSNTALNKSFQKLLEQEKGHDQSFTAIAEGSLFFEGLDPKPSKEKKSAE